jgi:K+-transporting ATPase KdpF subunit
VARRLPVTIEFRSLRTPIRSEHSHDGRRCTGHWSGLFRAVNRLRLRLRNAVRAIAMMFDYALAGLVMLGLLVYLTYALLKPEHF